jgi:hypothetical protein
MHFTRFATFLKFPGIKTSCRTFYTGVFLTQARWLGGPEAHVGSHAGQVGWGRGQPDLLLDTGDGRPWPAMRRAASRGEGSSRTGDSPGTRRWGRLGRRTAGDGEFDGGGPRFPARKRRLRRRLEARGFDSFG